MHLIEFFESLKFDIIYENIEFSTNDEQITVTKRDNDYLIYFSKMSDMFRTNLCKEILLITEENSDIKLNINDPLSHYFQLKFNKEKIDGDNFLAMSSQDFIKEFEKKLNFYPGFNYLYLNTKVRDKDENKKMKKHKL